MIASSRSLKTSTPPDAVSGQAAKSRRRRPPSPVEQRRREVWGKQWGAVGADYKRRRLKGKGR